MIRNIRPVMPNPGIAASRNLQGRTLFLQVSSCPKTTHLDALLKRALSAMPIMRCKNGELSC